MPDQNETDRTATDIGEVHTLSDATELENSRYGRSLAPGETFADRYVIERLIGVGGTGAVYRAADRVSGETLALKLLRTDRLVTLEAVQRLVNEAVTARSVRHRNVVAVYDVGIHAGQPFVSMELLAGRSLRAWIQEYAQEERNCPADVALEIALALADGLGAAHALGVIHRDLKPENIRIVDETGPAGLRLSILDFGLARAGGQTSQTATNVGSPHYMAPEQITAPDQARASADIYSLCVILYEMLVGVLPQGRFRLPGELRSDIPKAIDELLEAGLSNLPRMRPQSAAELRRKIEEAAPLLAVQLEKRRLIEAARLAQADYHAAPSVESYETAVLVGRKAAETGDGQAMVAFGWLLDRAPVPTIAESLAKIRSVQAGLWQPEEASLHWFEKAAAAGSAEGMFAMGIKAQDPKRSDEWLNRAAEAGSGKAMEWIARRHWRAGDEAAARDWMRRSAESGDASGMHAYGDMLMLGVGGPADQTSAGVWYRRSAEAGYKFGMTALARHLLEGYPDKARLREAREWLTRSAKADEWGAMLLLGWMWFEGLGGESDEAEARRWYLAPFKGQTIEATKSYAQALVTERSIPRGGYATRQWFLKLAEAGDVRAWLDHGWALEHGEGGVPDGAGARASYRRAAEGGDADGMHRLGLCLHRGVGGEADPAAAEAWYRKAITAGSWEAEHDLLKLLDPKAYDAHQ